MSWFREVSLSWMKRICINVLRAGQIPRHVAFIMDGNRRYAENNNMDKIEGHSKGFAKLSETLEWCSELGILEVTVFAFSIDNFKRSTEEVNALMDLAYEKFHGLLDEKDKLMENGVKIRIIGKLSLLPEKLRKVLAEIMRITQNNSKSFWNIAFSYTGREEITQAVSAVVRGVENGAVLAEDVSEDLLSSFMYTSPCHHPELLIRTSGEVRLSDFMLWQTPFSCLYFTTTLWPQFGLRHMLAAILHYQRSDRQLTTLQELDNSIYIPSRASAFIASVHDSRELVLS